MAWPTTTGRQRLATGAARRRASPPRRAHLAQLGGGHQPLAQAKQVALRVGHLAHHAWQLPLGGARRRDAAAGSQAPGLALLDLQHQVDLWGGAGGGIQGVGRLGVRTGGERARRARSCACARDADCRRCCRCAGPCVCCHWLSRGGGVQRVGRWDTCRPVGQPAFARVPARSPPRNTCIHQPNRPHPSPRLQCAPLGCRWRSRLRGWAAWTRPQTGPLSRRRRCRAAPGSG